MINHTSATHGPPPQLVMSEKAFAEWGLADVAYIKQETLNGQSAYVIHAANGEQMAATENRDLAAALIVQNDMTPVDVH